MDENNIFEEFFLFSQPVNWLYCALMFFLDVEGYICSEISYF